MAKSYRHGDRLVSFAGRCIPGGTDVWCGWWSGWEGAVITVVTAGVFLHRSGALSTILECVLFSTASHESPLGVPSGPAVSVEPVDILDRIDVSLAQKQCQAAPEPCESTPEPVITPVRAASTGAGTQPGNREEKSLHTSMLPKTSHKYGSGGRW